MSYASILVILSGGPDPVRGLAAAISVATAWDAHLEVLCVGVDAGVHSYSYADISPAVMQATLIEAQTVARSVSDAAQAVLAHQHVARYTLTPIVTQPALLAGLIRRYARFSDMVVMPRPYGPEAGPDAATCVEAALFEARVPVLILPDGRDVWTPPRRIAVGWNESDEALSATRHALPVLRAADTAFVAIVDPPQHGPDRSDPGGLLAQYLARHGVRCEVDVLAQTLPRIADHFVRLTADRDIDVLVMGAYGRARWSEAMFGGATRDMLERCPVPLLLAR